MMASRIGKNTIFIVIIAFFMLMNISLFAQTYFVKNYRNPQVGIPSSVRGIIELSNGDFLMLLFGSNNRAFTMAVDSAGHFKNYNEYYLNNSYLDNSLKNFALLDDGNLIFSGVLDFGSNQRSIIMKTSQNGSVLWCKYLSSYSFGSNYNFVIERENGNISLISSFFSSTGFIISDFDSAGNEIASSTISSNTPNYELWPKLAINLPNDQIIVAGRNSLQACIIKLDSTNNVTFAKTFPGYFMAEHLIQSYDNGFIVAVRDTGPNPSSCTLIKIDSLGMPVWTKSFSDTLKFITPQFIYENDDHTYYFTAIWRNKYSPLYNNQTAIFHLDSIGNVLSIKDSLGIQGYQSLTKTNDNRYCSLITQGSANNYNPGLLVTDNSFSQTFGLCMNFSISTIIQSSSTSTTIDIPHQKVNTNLTFSDTTINVNTTTTCLTAVCLPGGYSCNTIFSLISPSVCSSYNSPSGNYTWTTSGVYSDTIYNILGCDTIFNINLTILNPLPLQITGDSMLCLGDTATLSTTINYASYVWSTGDTTAFTSIYNSGIVYLSVIDSNGCEDSISFVVNILSYPTVSITAQGSTTFCQGDSVILSASPSLLSYQWYRWNTAIPGATSSNYTAKSRGKYKCIGLNAALCTDTSNTIIVNVPCILTGPNHQRSTHINELDIEEFLIYPNPGTGIFIIESYTGQLLIFNSIGEQVYSRELFTEENILDISAYPDGIYMFILNTEDSSFSHKILLKH